VTKTASPRLLALFLVGDQQSTVRRVPLRLLKHTDGGVYSQFIAKRSHKWNIVVRMSDTAHVGALDYVLFKDEGRP
jgi:hypothetical protein